MLAWICGPSRIEAAVEAPSGSAPANAVTSDPAVSDLAGWVARLTAGDVATRRAAAASIDNASAAAVPAIAKRLADAKRTADRDAMAEALARLGKPEGRAAAGFDPFEAAVASPAGSPGWRDLVTVMGLSRLLAKIGTTPAAREIVGIYAGFGDVMRADVERQIKVLGERAVAALIETRRGDAKPLRPWAAKQLEVLGKTLPGEAVQTADHQVLADVLRAYGRTKDTDAARVIVSFANSDRAQIRDAAREAVGMMGETGIWQLRESYENLVGKKAPEDWGWEKLSAELFTAYDRARLAEVYALMDEGLAAYKAKNLEAMAAAYDRVLARAPGFERRREMTGGYLELARSLAASDRARAMMILRKTLRIDPAGPRAKEAESQLAYLEALDLASHGVVDETAYRRAVELDPNNAEAKQALLRIQSGSAPVGGFSWRYALGALLAALACAGGVTAWRWRAAQR